MNEFGGLFLVFMVFVGVFISFIIYHHIKLKECKQELETIRKARGC
jgi:hypothetical protein